MTHNRNAELLAAAPRWLAAELRPHAGRLASAIMAEVQRSVPAYARPLTGRFGRAFTEGVEQAVRHVIDSIGNPGVTHQDWVELFRDRGRLEFLDGRSLDSLQAAARIGARVAWQYIAPILRRTGASPSVLADTAEILFAYVDELSSVALEGYSETQTLASGTIERRRRRLLEKLLSGTPTTAGLEGMARGAGWTLPAEAAVVALERTSGSADFPVELLDDDVLVDLESSEPCLLTTRPRGHLLALTGRWNGWHAAVSPTVPLAQARAAHRLARRALTLLPPDGNTGEPIVWCVERLATIWLVGEDFLANELRARTLAPLSPLGEKQRARLSETLLAWLETRGGAPEIAKRLKVHPQTVRARLHQLREVFGDRLDDADERFGMRLALRAELLATAPAASTVPLL